MIDIHSHILPAVDDGSENTEQSLTMLKEAQRKGITDIILTPHYCARYLTDRQGIERMFTKFKKAVKDAGVNVSLYLGQEIYVFEDLLKVLNEGKLITMNGGKHVLVEFPTKQETDISETVYELKTNGYIPIVAHIDRYAYADKETAREIKEVGGLIQINATTLCGSLFRRHRAFELIKEGLVDFIASDVHYKRRNDMLKAYRIVSRKFGRETAEKLFTENAKIIINK